MREVGIFAMARFRILTADRNDLVDQALILLVAAFILDQNWFLARPTLGYKVFPHPVEVMSDEA